MQRLSTNGCMSSSTHGGARSFFPHTPRAAYGSGSILAIPITRTHLKCMRGVTKGSTSIKGSFWPFPGKNGSCGEEAFFENTSFVFFLCVWQGSWCEADPLEHHENAFQLRTLEGWEVKDVARIVPWKTGLGYGTHRFQRTLALSVAHLDGGRSMRLLAPVRRR
jgi:hypothetical protein